MSCSKEELDRMNEALKVEPGYSPDGKLMEFSMVLNNHSTEAINQVREKLKAAGYNVSDLSSDIGKGIAVMGHVGIGFAETMARLPVDPGKTVLIVDDEKDWAKELFMGFGMPHRVGLKDMELPALETIHANPADSYIPRYNPYKSLPSPHAEKRLKKKRRAQRKARTKNRRKK